MGCGGCGGFGGGASSQTVQVRCFDFDFADLAAAALVNDIEAWSMPAKYVIHGVIVRPTEAFAGGAITDYKVSVGLAAPNLEKYLLKFDVDTAPAGTNVGNGGPSLELNNYSAVTSLRLAAYSVGANLDQAVAGALTLCVYYSVVP